MPAVLVLLYISMDWVDRAQTWAPTLLCVELWSREAAQLLLVVEEEIGPRASYCLLSF